MDKAEALEFIGLKEPLTEGAIHQKYTERFNYFQMLYTNAPNKIIEKIQKQNLEKLNQVKKILLDEVLAKNEDFNKKYTNPFTGPKLEPVHTEEKQTTAWLIVHTEDRKSETYNLYEGINYIGRKKKEGSANNVVIEDDPFVSRTHAFIKCKELNGRLHFELYDGDGSEQSKNGVFLNGNSTRINKHCSLRENDTIQIGATKLVFKIRKEHRSISGELEEVLKTDFIRTIDIHK